MFGFQSQHIVCERLAKGGFAGDLQDNAINGCRYANMRRNDESQVNKRGALYRHKTRRRPRPY
jgi:hypothetical protein